jgi:hypothetical protein
MAVRRGPSLLSPTGYLRYHAVRKGVWGGSRLWMVVGVFVYAPRLLRRLGGRTEEVVATERLLPGEFVRIEALRAPSRAERKAAKRSAR